MEMFARRLGTRHEWLKKSANLKVIKKIKLYDLPIILSSHIITRKRETGLVGGANMIF